MALSSRVGPIPYTKVPEAVGQTRKVVLEVQKINVEPGGDIFLHPDTDKIDFQVVIPGSFREFFPKNPEFYYQGKKVRVNGLIEQKGTAYRVVVKNQTQITVIKW